MAEYKPRAKIAEPWYREGKAMTALLLRMARLLRWAQSVITWEYDAQGQEYDNRRAWLKETGIVLDEIRQRTGR